MVRLSSGRSAEYLQYATEPGQQYTHTHLGLLRLLFSIRCLYSLAGLTVGFCGLFRHRHGLLLHTHNSRESNQPPPTYVHTVLRAKRLTLALGLPAEPNANAST
jgi:hypothetical protein